MSFTVMVIDSESMAAESKEMVLTIEYDYDGHPGTFELEIPTSDALFIEMGDLTLNPARDSAPLEE